MFYTDAELATLATFDMLKAFARKDALERMGLEYSPEADNIGPLVARGLIKVRKNGAMVLDKKRAREVMSANFVPEQYRWKLSNPHMQFKSRS